MPTFPDTGAFSCIGRELGMPIESNFSSMSASPIAAAGLCQVYKAQLKYSGQTVTVKVQRPGIEEAIGLDLYVDIIMTDVVVLIDEFARRVYQELNYVQLLLGPDGEEIRSLTIKEAVRVTEVVILGSVADSYNSAPCFVQTPMINGKQG
ncbi:hypothetical protein V6N13_037936 [Hibiscus sabdariffa]